MNHSVALTSQMHALLCKHLLRDVEQEDLCFAVWYPSNGSSRASALLYEPVLPRENERHLHGNASVTSEYFERALHRSMELGGGVAFMHSHTGPGWQGMSGDDIRTERAMAAQAKAGTGFPLVGLTVGIDGTWSARFWEKFGPASYERAWCQSVRILGDGMEVAFADELCPPPKFRDELKRTISAWGIAKQQKLARLKVGVVGAGSVGSIVAETLARMGIQEVTLIDFDFVEQHNMDRLLHATKQDWLKRRLKVEVLAKALKKGATAKNFLASQIPYGVTEEEGFRAALDCDVLVSCVDRPWGRYVLNLIAYAHLIPVVDGGIAIRTKADGSMLSADWQAHIAMPTRRCLECLGQYNSAYVELERRGQLDDPRYIDTLPADHHLRRNENVFPFSANLASLQVMQMISLVVKPLSISDSGTQTFRFVTGSMDVEHLGPCPEHCLFPGLVAKGDRCGFKATGDHPKAQEIRQTRASSQDTVLPRIKSVVRRLADKIRRKKNKKDE